MVAVTKHHLAFWDAMLWALAGMRHLLSEDFQDGFELERVVFVNPFAPSNDVLIDQILPAQVSRTS